MSSDERRDKSWHPSRRGVGLGLSAFIAAPAMAQQPSARDLVAAAHEVSRFANARFRGTLTIAGNSGATRVRELTGVARIVQDGLATARLVRVIAPADMRGVGTLTIDRDATADDLWVYLPSLRKVRRLVSSNRRDPWMGSDFSYGDVVGIEVAEWRHTNVRRETIRNEACVVVESTPLQKATSSETGYSRRLAWLRETDSFALRAEYFDLAGRALKHMEAADVRLLDRAGGKSQAMRIIMTGPRSQSTLAFQDFNIDATVSEDEVAPGALTP